MQTVRVAVTGGIEPKTGHVFAVPRRRQQPVDDFFISVRRLVGEKGVDFGDRGRQSRQIERDAANQRFPAGFGRG